MPSRKATKAFSLGRKPKELSETLVRDGYDQAEMEAAVERSISEYGNYTLRPLLDSMPDNQAEQLRSMFAEP